MTLRPADHAAATTATTTKPPSPLIRLSLLQTLIAWLRGSAEAVAQLLAPTTALPALLEALETALAEPAEDVHVRGHLGALLGLLLATAPTASFERPVLVRMDDDPDTLALESFKALVVAQDETNRTISREAAELRVRVEAMETELRIARGAAGELDQLKRQLKAALEAQRQAEQSASDTQLSAAAELAALREELSGRAADLEAAVRESEAMGIGYAQLELQLEVALRERDAAQASAVAGASTGGERGVLGEGDRAQLPHSDNGGGNDGGGEGGWVAKLAVLQSTIDGLRRAKAALEATAAESVLEMADLRREIADLRREIADLRLEIERERASAEEALAARAVAEDALDASTVEGQVLQARCRQLEASLSDATAALGAAAAAESAVRAASERTVAELEAQLGELQAQLRAAQSDGANAREQLQVLQEAAAAAATRAIGAQEGAPSMAQVAGVNESNQPAIREAISMQVDASKLASLTAEAARAAQLEAEIAELRREQDELLICIAEQDQGGNQGGTPFPNGGNCHGTPFATPLTSGVVSGTSVATMPSASLLFAS
ncbi:hypothetical protein Ctob_000270 [Chrysochromulina tobinii]|uniref:Uncharacterized protein n=1 Tax=Chrysochromulina tobinii TaxID=1460289 RepID=A0A0M0J5L0_9EUKA|nr:hypothetical protein Ctob_000270 [Chrysochromulina tobinii]|eukprot:KOO21891.1 hypothetical protein Ctob_000270 [Chrysochromulina sp. CCMP291]